MNVATEAIKLRDYYGALAPAGCIESGSELRTAL